MKKIEAIQRTLADVSGLVQRACLIASEAPFFMYSEQEFAKLEIDGDNATLFWPEWAGGYYAGDGNIERQSVSFPAHLLVMSLSEITAWQWEEKQKHEDKEKQRSAEQASVAAGRQNELELMTLTHLMKKHNVKMAR